jgi:two-component system cell cycle sensor histidine kinase/response regulator CckA
LKSPVHVAARLVSLAQLGALGIFTIGLVLLLGWLARLAERQGLISDAFGDGLAALGSVLIVVMVIWRTAASHQRQEEARRRVEQELLESHQYNRKLFENSPIGLALCRMDGSLVDVNPAYAAIIGRTVKETLTMSYWDITPLNYADHEQKQIARLREAGRYGPYEKEYIHQDGRLIPVRLTGVLVEHNGETMIWSSVEDISGRKKLEETILDSEHRYRALFEGAPYGILVADAATHAFLHANKAICDMLGYSVEELTRLDLRRIHPPESLPAVLRSFEAQARGELRTAPDLPCRRKDGSGFLADIHTIPVELVGRACLVGFFTDVTGRNQALAQLRVQSTAMEAAADAMVITDGPGIISWINPAFTALTGYTAADIVGQPASILGPERQADPIYRAIQETVSAGKAWRGEVLNRRKDGSLYTEELTVTPVCAGGGAVTHQIAIKKDITARKREEAQRHEQQKLTAIGTLASGMAHEINNPLCGIMSFAELIRDKAAGDASLVQHAESILVEGRQVARMTHNLLNFTQQANGQAPGACSPAELAAAALPGVTKAARVAGIELVCDIPPGLPEVVCRQGQIGQILTALLTNALESLRDAPTGGIHPKTIRLSARSLDQAGRRWLRLTVEDNGPGIPGAIQPRLFEPFFTTKDRSQHPGLGLWISRSLAHYHGGDLTVENESGPWTRFHVDLPLAPD